MKRFLVCLFAAIFLFTGGYFGVKAKYPLLYAETARACGVDPKLACAVMKAESGFRTDTVSRAGAVGLMQVLPSTAQFVCAREDIVYREELLTDGAYNVKIGCLYLAYLFDKFPKSEVALAAYNAGEGVVAEWLRDPNVSDGLGLKKIPYAETRRYVKKVGKFRKIYDFFY